MSPKHWKLLIIAPLSALFLTACPDNGISRSEQARAGTVSQYSGSWINSALDRLYSSSNGNNSAFCQSLATGYDRYGITSDQQTGRLIIDAWLITARGEVMVYDPNYLSYANYREIFFKGTIDSNGVFSRGNARLGMPGMSGSPMMNNPYYFSYMNTRVIRRDESLIVYGNSAPRTYVRIKEERMLQLYGDVHLCFDQNDSYNNNQQPNPYGQYGVVPPPVPRGEEYGQEEIYRKGGSRRVMGPPAPVPPPMPGPGPGPMPGPGPVGGAGVGGMPDMMPGGQ